MFPGLRRSRSRENRLVIARGGEGEGAVTANGYRVSFLGNTTVLEFVVM